jgi:hypothetical protein
MVRWDPSVITTIKLITKLVVEELKAVVIVRVVAAIVANENKKLLTFKGV